MKDKVKEAVEKLEQGYVNQKGMSSYVQRIKTVEVIKQALNTSEQKDGEIERLRYYEFKTKKLLRENGVLAKYLIKNKKLKLELSALKKLTKKEAENV